MSESQNYCIHELLKDTCSYCSSFNVNLPKFVYITRSGNVFHSRSNCEALLDGQLFASRSGKSTHEIQQVVATSIRDRGMCEWCFSSYLNEGVSCQVKIDNEWFLGEYYKVRPIGHGNFEYMVKFRDASGVVIEKSLRRNVLKF